MSYLSEINSQPSMVIYKAKWPPNFNCSTINIGRESGDRRVRSGVNRRRRGEVSMLFSRTYKSPRTNAQQGYAVKAYIHSYDLVVIAAHRAFWTRFPISTCASLPDQKFILLGGKTGGLIKKKFDMSYSSMWKNPGKSILGPTRQHCFF